MTTEKKTVELLSLLDGKTSEVHVPAGITAVHNPADGPCIIKGKLVNEGEIAISGGKTDKVVIVAGELVNTGKLMSKAHSLSICTSVIENHGQIESAHSLKIQSTNGRLALDCNNGSMSAETEIVMDARSGINVIAGDFTAPSIRFNAEAGRVRVAANTLTGEVEVDARSAAVGTKSGKLDLGQQRLLSGNHVYYNINGNVSAGGVSHGSDPVAILASGDISASSITAGELTIAAGVNFQIDGQYPDPTQDTDADVSWTLLSTYGYGDVDISGTLTAANATILGVNVTIGGTVNVSQDLEITTPSPGGGTVEFSDTVEASNLTIAAFDITFSDELTLSENLDISSAFDNGTVLFSADVDIDGDATVVASQIDFEGDDFDIEGVLELGNQYSAYINLAGTFTASDDVTFNGYQVIFDGEDFTMDGEDKAFHANASTRIEATGTIAIDSDVDTDHAVNLLFFCDGDVKTGSITVDNSEGSWAGAVIIKSNRNGGSSEFIIGGEDNSNGVNGQIVTDTVNGGSTESTSFAHGCVYITNGGDGGITLTNAGDISVKGTSSKSGGITLDAEDGTITLPAGTLSADGTGNYAGAFIQLLADTIETEDGTVISASDNGEAGKQKLVQIAANTINLTGSSGLTIKANGDGNSSNPTTLQIVPKGSVELHDNDSTTFFYYWYTTNDSFYNGSYPVQFAGSGSAALNISSNGSHNRVYASAYPLTFNTGDTTIECKGAENHQIDIQRYQASGSAGLAFSGGDVTIDASGPDSGDGDGGQITINIDYVSRSANGKTTVKADGKGEGDGGRIIFYPGAVSSDYKLGMDDEQFAFLAKGGATSGNGGRVELWGWTASIKVHDAGEVSTPIDVSARGSDGDGGQIDIVAYGSNGLTFDGNASYIKADSGSSSGNGGRITILAAEEVITIGSGTAGAVNLSAISNGDGDGGTIDLTAWAGITADAAHVAATADGSGKGGHISLSAGYSTFTLSGEINADGGDDDGEGGLIELEGGQILATENESITLSANGGGEADGGEIHVLTNWGAFTIGDEGSISANGGDDDGEGGLVEILSAAGLDLTDLTEDKISVKGGGSSDGGDIILRNSSEYNVNKVNNIDPGPTGMCTFGSRSIASLTECTNAGTISHEVTTGPLQGVATLTKWATGESTWPKIIYSALNVGAEAPNALEQTVIDAIIDNVTPGNGSRTNMGRTEFYLFNSSTEWKIFLKKFGITVPTNPDDPDFYGLTFEFTDNEGKIVYYTSVFGGLFSQGDEEKAAEVSIHEIGHALDHLLGFQSAVSNTSYNNYVTKDFLRFDWTDWDSNGGIAPRDPLDAFEGLEDYILDEEEELKEEFQGKTNSYILQQISPYFFATKQARWQELYAQAFAYESYVQYNDPSDWLYEIPDTLFYHGFFPCTRNWAARIKNGFSTPDGGSACDPAPDWYQIADVLPS